MSELLAALTIMSTFNLVMSPIVNAAHIHMLAVCCRGLPRHIDTRLLIASLCGTFDSLSFWSSFEDHKSAKVGMSDGDVIVVLEVDMAGAWTIVAKVAGAGVQLGERYLRL